MAKDLIIGAFSNYGFDAVKPWIQSINDTGFEGDKVLICINTSENTQQQIRDAGFQVVAQPKSSNMMFHMERFYHIYNFLKDNRYRYVITTDVKDVVFQKNPVEYIDQNIGDKKLMFASESLLYKDEPWGNQNLLETFGPYFHSIFKHNLIFNVGVLAGRGEDMRDLACMIFNMSINRPIPIVDQAVFNFLINQCPFKDEVLVARNSLAWAAQLGVTKQAIEAGAGDIGLSVRHNPALLDEYIKLYQDEQPIIDGATVRTEHNEFCIVHQWDRIPSLKAEIEKKYGNT